MPIIVCERCGARTAKPVQCNYCGKYVCLKCLKSQKRISKKEILKISICKECWTKMPMREKYKNNQFIVF